MTLVRCPCTPSTTSGPTRHQTSSTSRRFSTRRPAWRWPSRALDGTGEALVEAGLPAHEHAPIDRSRAEVEAMQRILTARLARIAAPIGRSAAITDLVEHDRRAEAPAAADGAPDTDAALALLFGESGIGYLETETGRHLTAVVEYRTGGLVTVSTDAGMVQEGDSLHGAIVDASGTPWRVALRVESGRDRGDRSHLALRHARDRPARAAHAVAA
jgi:hypothetical protein